MPLTQRQIFRRRRIVVFSAVGVALATAFYLPMTLLAPLSAVSASVITASVPELPQPELELPSYGASAIAAIDRTGLLAQSGSAEPLPIASITKIITALVVLDAKPLAVDEAGPTITFGETDLDYYYTQQAQNGLVWPVSDGQELSQREVMNVVLLASANNYAQSLAHWAYGTDEAFVAAAAAWLSDHGLENTTLTEASGIQESNRSTVEDLTKIARLAIDDPVVAAIVAAPSAEVPGLGTVENRNQLLGIDGVDGIKTGTLDDWACLLFSTDVTIAGEVKTFVGVVLGGPDHPTVAAAIRTLIADATAGYTEVELVSAGEEFAEYDTPWGDEARAIAADAVSRVVWGTDEISVTVDADPVRLANQGTDAGVVHVRIGTETIDVPLQFSDEIDDPGLWWRLTNPQSLF
ncbi:D-alanyl-D-alanine carboxypeptidase family protein [Salinibacterium sp. M195]|uniref:D-alanyl-D-alanine carboxypeptidase family protein n=1 Tax=Salinibacterium sp. M195 TaxID=2583374 RepID=UPI002102475D|nr:D-alanyl-D-alanine carboxypeptidase [Salinibacterium sp. M195]QYH36198.1 D-alanyl-D-alanine carboxypeptidase [Salinibacterium sp. M195]